MGKLYSFLVILSFCIPSLLSAQELKVEGYFLQDSAKLGERISYVLKATYQPHQQVIFPDSTYQFRDMEYLGRQTFVTQTRDSLTQDSVVYHLSNFSLDPVRNFGLPVYEILKYDSLEYFAQDDELYLKLTIDEIPELPMLKDNDTYQRIAKEFNYPYLYIALSAIGILGLVTYFAFGQNIYSQWLVWLEKRRWKRFEKRWADICASFIEKPTPGDADGLLGLWKHYLELVTGRPYKEWTSTEVAKDLPREGILNDLRKIELIIYADRKTEDLPLICEHLKADCRNMYQQKIRLIHERE